MELKLKAQITLIHHDLIEKKSKIYFNHGKDEMIFIRPMRKKFEWKHGKNEGIKSGDYVEILMRKIKDGKQLHGFKEIRCYCGHRFKIKTVREGTATRVIEPIICPKCGKKL